MGRERHLYYYQAKVVSVYDGDTIRANVDLGFFTWRREIQFRLKGIDAPELRLEEYDDGIISRDRLRELILDKWVMIETYKTGKYGRWIADIYLLDENGEAKTDKSVNQVLLDEGLAEPYKE